MSEYAKTGKFWDFPFSCSAEFLPCFSAWRSYSPPLGGGHFWPKYLPLDGSEVPVVKNITLKILPSLSRHLAIMTFFPGPLRCRESEVLMP